MKIIERPQQLIEYFSIDYPEIPDVLAQAEKIVPKYKGSVQPFQAAFLYWLTMQHVPTFGDVLEIGTGLGYSAYVMVNAKVDAFVTTLNPNEDECKIAYKSLKKFTNVGIVRKTSREYFDLENGLSYDLIFIDGNHNDIEFDVQWYDRLKENGIIVFHDYSPEDSWSPCLPVWNKLNEMKEVWGEPLYEVFDNGNVGMIAWQKNDSDKVLNELVEQAQLEGEYS